MLGAEEFARTSKRRRKPSLVVRLTERPSPLHFTLQTGLDCSIVKTGSGRAMSKTETVDLDDASRSDEVVEWKDRVSIPRAVGCESVASGEGECASDGVKSESEGRAWTEICNQITTIST